MEDTKIKFIADESDDGKRIDTFLAEISDGISRSKIQTLIKSGENVCVNKKPVKPSYIIKENDVIEYSDFAENINNIPAQDIQLDIVYEDNNMLVVNKPSGMLTHPTTTEKEGTLVNALLYKYGGNLSDLNGEYRRGILHRLDRNTSGLLMIAKNNESHEFLAKQIQDKTVVKKYLAVVKGVVDSDMRLDYPISRHKTQPHKMAVSEDGKPSLTDLRVLRKFHDATLVELTLHTGRTHQIRVHLSHIGHPVYNDTLYGFGKMRIKTEEQVLQSYKLEFTKPFSDEIIKPEIPMDEKLVRVIGFLEQNELKEK